MLKAALNEILNQVQKAQEKVAKVQDGLERIEVEASSGGGMVTVRANGKKEILDIKIEKELLQPESIDMLEALVISAVNEALLKSHEVAQQEMSKATGGMFENLPGFLQNHEFLR
ncbi:YbaB/EbfC family nucleoid-associated protein [candidate division KSB1 bacterium]|nr:YbaB/EbfC family nucleoid-associated protein [candidate division KSB1 bacterium]